MILFALYFFFCPVFRFLALYFEKNCIARCQSELRIFFMYIIRTVIVWEKHARVNF